MVRLLRAIAFVLMAIMTIGAIRPTSAANTFAAEREVYRVTLIDNGERSIHESSARTVGSFLEELGIELHPYDNLHPHYRRRLENRLTIQITRAFYIDVAIDDNVQQIKVSPGTTTEEVLTFVQNNNEVALLFNGDDEGVVNEESVLEFLTWRSEVETATETIPYSREYNTTPSLSSGVEYVRQEGTEGERLTSYNVIFIGNEEHYREQIDEVIVEPIPKIIDRGIGGSLGTLTDTSCPSFHYVRRLTMNASAYTAGVTCTGKTPDHPLYGITASGRRVEHGIVAVDPRVIPLGTRLYVEGYGFALAADTGSAIRGYKIDLFMYELEDAIRFGRREITVFVLD